MSDSKTIDPRIWNDERFHTLSPTGKLLVLYLLTGPANRIGVFKFSQALAAEDTGLPVASVEEGVCEVCQCLGWRQDPANRLVYLPTWWKYHSPSTPKQLMGVLKDLHELPESPLVDAFCKNTQFLPEPLHVTFHEECQKHRPRSRCRTQKAEGGIQHAEAPARPDIAANESWAIELTIPPPEDSFFLAREAVLSSWNVLGGRGPKSRAFT